MISPLAFTVLTDFRFEVGSAIANSNALQSAVGGVSQAADSALFSFQKLSTGIAATMGLGTGSLLGVFSAAMQASDKFQQSQRDFANIISANMAHLTGSVGTFEERMAASENIMRNINKLAQEFSLPSGELLQMSKLMAATLTPKGLAGQNFGTAIDISRNFLKSAPSLGVSPGLAQGQLIDLVQGRANLGDTLFSRLMNETEAFKPFNKQGGPQAFNALDSATRVKLISQAFKQFANDAKVLEGNAKSLSGEMRRLGEALKGPFSILKPLGDVLNASVTSGILNPLNNYLTKEGASMVKDLAKMLEPLLKSPENLLVTMLQLRDLQRDTQQAGRALGVVGALMLLSHALKFLGIQASVARLTILGLGTAMGSVGAGIVFLGTMLFRFIVFITGASGVFSGLMVILNGIVTVASRVLVPFMLLLGALQLLSRSLAIAKVSDAKDIATSMPAFTNALTRLKIAFAGLVKPFADVFDKIAQGIAPLFKLSYYFDFLISVMNTLTEVIVLFRAGLQGVFFALFEIVRQIGTMEIFRSGSMTKIQEAFTAGIDQMIEENMAAIENGEAVVNQTTNIGKIDIVNNFKQQMEPDRIAFTLKDQLMKAANNPGQAANRSLQGAFAR